MKLQQQRRADLKLVKTQNIMPTYNVCSILFYVQFTISFSLSNKRKTKKKLKGGILPNSIHSAFDAIFFEDGLQLKLRVKIVTSTTG